MTTKRTIEETNGIFFITFTCHKWLQLFSITKSYDLVYRWFDILLARGHLVLGYVIMPNHVHVVLKLNSSKSTINTIVSNGKRFMAYQIIKRLEEDGNTEVLNELSKGGLPFERKKGQLHKVFEPSFDIKVCKTPEFIKQKLDYMHNNPCNKNWRLVDEPVKYKHSSMRFYAEYNETNNSKLTNYRLVI